MTNKEKSITPQRGEDINKEYYASIIEEMFGEGPYKSREEAIKLYSHDYGLMPGDVVYTGAKSLIRISGKLLLDFVFDHIMDQVYEQCGEVANSYDLNITKESREDLEIKLTALLNDWVKEHKVLPPCFPVVDIQEHIVGEEI